MPPIPVHIDDPITPVKADGATPKTSEQLPLPQNNATTTTQNDSPAYPPARPGAAAVPAPTPYLPRPQPQPSRTTQPSVAQIAPPPPQPGAVPIPPSQQAYNTASSTLPPPPRAGESLHQRQVSMPNQTSIPSPQQNFAPTHSTTSYMPSPSRQQGSGGPTTLNMGPVTAHHEPQSAHPPGYQQNAYAQEMSPAQRSSLEEQERRESIVAGLGFGGGGGSASAASPVGGDGGEDSLGNMWNAVKGWANTAGEKLAETEESVWRRINGH